MATLQTQYQNYLKENPTSKLTYDEWIDQVWLLNKLNKQEPPFVSDDFQIGPDGAFELGDDVIAEIVRLKAIINEN